MKTDGSRIDVSQSSSKNSVSRSSVPVDKQQSLSMLRALGLMLANGARADARDSRERMRRQLARLENSAGQGGSDGPEAR